MIAIGCKDRKIALVVLLAYILSEKPIIIYINPGLSYHSGNPLYLTVYNNKMYFSASVNNDAELWESDGTVSGTKLAVNINPINSSYPSYLTVFH